jgi:hypothetical protein
MAVERPRPLTPPDFAVLAPEKQRDPLFNESRRIVRARIGAFGKLAARELRARTATTFETRSSLHHPSAFNGHRVEALWFTLHPGKAARAALRERLGQEFAEDLDPSYFHALLFGELRRDSFTVGLRINERAWWDTQNLQRACREPPHAQRLSAALRALPEYGMRIHDWQKTYRCEEMTPGMLETFARWFKPGEHRFLLWRAWPAESPDLAAPGWPQALVAELERLVPVWRIVSWAPENDLVFRGGGARGGGAT